MKPMLGLVLFLLAGCSCPPPETTIEKRAVYVPEGKLCGACGWAIKKDPAWVVQVPGRQALYVHEGCW